MIFIALYIIEEIIYIGCPYRYRFILTPFYDIDIKSPKKQTVEVYF